MKEYNQHDTDIKRPRGRPKKIMKKPPVKVGDIMTITPTGMGEKDPFYNHDGFIIFIKRIPHNKNNSPVTIQITSVKETYAFSEYKEG